MTIHRIRISSNARERADTRLRYRVTLPVLGLPVGFQADDAAVLAAVHTALGCPRFAAGPSASSRADDGARSPEIRFLLRAPAVEAMRAKATDATATGATATDGRATGATATDVTATDGMETDATAAGAKATGERAPLAASLAAPLGTNAMPEPADQPELRVRTDHRRRLILRGRGIAALADLRRLQAVCFVEPSAFQHGDHFTEVLDTLTLALVTRLDRVPVHAAAVAQGKRAVVLAGPSGAGKSTIAFAALRAGLRVLDDDAVYLQLEPRLRVWGKGRRLHLTPDAVALFPELADRSLVFRSNGKWKIPVAIPPLEPEHATAQPESSPVLPVAEEGVLCLLERGEGPVRLQALSAREVEEAIAELLGALEGGFHAFHDLLGPRLRALARGGVWRLRLSDDPAAAVSCIRGLLGRVEGRGARGASGRD